MKKALTIISLCALSLMATEIEETTYVGTLLSKNCTNGCTYANYTKNDPLIAVIDGKQYTIVNPKISEPQLEVALGHDDVSFKGVIEGNRIIASEIERVPDMKGFLGIQSCADKGEFSDCDLKKYSDGDKVVAVIGGKTYQLDKQTVSKTKIDHAIMQNGVGFFGKIDGDTLKLENMIYEGGKKEFFKGCV
ncbi:MAG: hypothetical protein PHW18_07575 [Sulfuricurvum sp.]|uniref:hypothetical protein n=1 Tax=Sulfuricurvum sp. TaxID=2025608 RepID=UPI00260450A0|nr:hypothetical protein [Sulfuricurvum sp.]MDD2829414.1 hypothetical protein [Sulfuricurvum sp.]MDD4948224.1 hypothetical protein [Sulfuricurvum sp.]